MTARVILLCHAATAAMRAGRFPDDEAIEPDALSNGAVLAARLPRVDAVVSGRERRCLDTAEALGLAATPSAELDDWSVGAWRGRVLAEIATAAPDLFAAWRSGPDAAPEGGESLRALLARVGAWLDARMSARKLLAVTHPAVVRAAVVHVLAAPPSSFWQVDAGPLALVDLRHDGRRWALRSSTLDAF